MLSCFLCMPSEPCNKYIQSNSYDYGSKCTTCGFYKYKHNPCENFSANLVLPNAEYGTGTVCDMCGMEKSNHETKQMEMNIFHCDNYESNNGMCKNCGFLYGTHIQQISFLKLDQDKRFEMIITMANLKNKMSDLVDQIKIEMDIIRPIMASANGANGEIDLRKQNIRKLIDEYNGCIDILEIAYVGQIAKKMQQFF